MKTKLYVLIGCAAVFSVFFAACDNIPDEFSEVTYVPEPDPEPDSGSEALPTNAVDLGLSVAWGTQNLGASVNNPQGGYYCYGALSESETSCTIASSIINICNSKYDVARQTRGLGWRLPTKNELQELIDNCSWKAVTQNGVNGFRITGKNNNSIFIPISGYYNSKYASSTTDNEYAVIASGERYASYYGPYILRIFEKYDYSITRSVTKGEESYYRFPIRPVYDKTLLSNK